MIRAYSRITEVKEIADSLSSGELMLYRPNKKKAKWDDVIESSTRIGVFLNPKSLKILDETPLHILKNPLFRDTVTYISKDKTTASKIIFPTIRGREDYKPQLAHFYGLAAGYTTDSDEYNLVLSYMFEYFYFLLHENNPEETFSLRNLTKRVSLAKAFETIYSIYYEDPRTIDIREFERFIANCLQNFSSLEASLQLIDRKDTDLKGILGIVDDIIQKKGTTEEILRNSGIETQDYKTLKKTIDRFKMK